MEKTVRKNKSNLKLCVTRPKDSQIQSGKEDKEVFTQEDEEKIKERLKNLGYM